MVDIQRFGIQLPIHASAVKPLVRPYICSIAVFDSGSVVLADFKNDCVKYLNADYEFKDEMRLPDFPWVVCAITATEFAVSVPRAAKVMFIDIIEDELHYVREFATEYYPVDCRAVCYMDELLFLGFSSAPPYSCVKVATLDGTVLNVIRSDPEGNALFHSTSRMAVKRIADVGVGEARQLQNRYHADRAIIPARQHPLPETYNCHDEEPSTSAMEEASHVIYVSDEIRRQIIVVDSAGRLLVIYNRPNRTFDICVSPGGHLLYNMSLDREVYMLHDGKHTCIMSRNQLDLVPEAIAYNYKRNDIILSFYEIVKAYNMD